MKRLFVLLLLFVSGIAHAETPSLPWKKWDPALFDQAGKENKYILLHMAAVWCHWCHVMEGTTYADPAIQKTILGKFIPVRVDQDISSDGAGAILDFLVATTAYRLRREGKWDR